MAIRIKSRGNESAEQLMRRFKKLCEKEGLTKDIRKKEYYEKPSERKNRLKRKAAPRRHTLHCLTFDDPPFWWFFCPADRLDPELVVGPGVGSGLCSRKLFHSCFIGFCPVCRTIGCSPFEGGT